MCWQKIFKGLTFNDNGCYEPDSAIANEAKGDTASNTKLASHTTDRKKIKVTDTSNRYFQQKILSNRTLPIITTII